MLGLLSSVDAGLLVYPPKLTVRPIEERGRMGEDIAELGVGYMFIAAVQEGVVVIVRDVDGCMGGAVKVCWRSCAS